MLTEDVRRKYYELCLTWDSYLHNLLLKSINYILATGIILETIKIAEYISGCKISTSSDDFAMWDKTLEGIEGFLRSWLSYLMSLAVEIRETSESKRCARS